MERRSTGENQWRIVDYRVPHNGDYYLDIQLSRPPERPSDFSQLTFRIMGWLWPVVWLAIIAGMWRIYAAIF